MIDHRFETVSNSDIDLRVAVAGGGPLMLFVHGWPELWYSWRHQMAHFADRYTVAAMDVRGYGGSSRPTEVERYTLRELTGDAAAVIDALGDGSAIVVGHDWGAPIAWNTARLHADKVSAVAGLSVPYMPVGPVSSLELWRQIYEGRFFYQLYFQEPGVAEAELSGDHARSLRMIWYSASADARDGGLIMKKGPDATMLDGLVDPDPFPSWSTPEDHAVYAEAFAQSGWTGPLNRYRAQDLDAEQLGSLEEPGAVLTQPTAFIAGEFDPVRKFVEGVDIFEMADANCSDFRGATIVPGTGHWVQQEAPAATNAALDDFVRGL